MDFVKVCSPREYNFATDTIEVEIEYSFKALMDYIKNNEVAFSGYIKDNNTSYDGFCAF